MRLEKKFLIIALLSLALAVPVSFALKDRTNKLRIEKTERQKIELKIDSVEKKAEEDRQNLEKQEKENLELRKQLQSKLDRKAFLAKLEFPVGNAPAWKVRDALAYYLDQGLSKTAASYLVGNLVAESGLNEVARGDGGLAYGLAQWHPNRRGDMPADFHGQLAFVLVEMQRKTPEAYRILTGNPSASDCARAMKIFEGYGIEGGRHQLGTIIAAKI